MPEIIDKFTAHLKDVLTRALCYAVDHRHTSVGPEHLLWALATQKGCIAAEVLRKNNLTLSSIARLAEQSETPTDGSLPLTPPLSDEAKRLVEKAVLIAHMYRHRYIGTEHLLSAMLQISHTILKPFFVREQASVETIQDQLTHVLRSTSRFPEMEALLEEHPEDMEGALALQEEEDANAQKDQTPALDYFTRNLTDPEVAQTMDPVIAREDEMVRLMQILCRRTKNNPILLGEPGVGKTAVVEGLAKKIAEGEVPQALAGKEILALDLASVIAGTMYRGEFEARLKQIIDELTDRPDVMLFIDEIHTVMGAGAAAGSLDAANILKPALARGAIRCIGATTPTEFKKHIEADAAFERRFQVVRINEPDTETTLKILEGLVPHYASYHRVHITPEALRTAIRLSSRYVTDRFLPDKAIDLIDEAAASLRVEHMLEGKDAVPIRTLEVELREVRDAKRQAVIEEAYDEARALKEKEHALIEMLEAERKESLPETIGTVDTKTITHVVSRSTGIPVDELLHEERQELRALEDRLRKHVVGQDRALKAVADAVVRAKTGVSNPRRPLASFLFVGPSGVGKTELARALAKELFQDEEAIIKLDMSEYNESFAVSKLVGSPAGYVGYREGTHLTDRVKEKPYAVVLFDEFEKAHIDAQNLLLQILETGELKDATGRVINFRNTIIILTSNVGMERYGGVAMGFQEGIGNLRALEDSIHGDLKERFRPELLNRVDRLLIFEPLTSETLTAIIQLQLDALKTRLEEQGVTFSYAKPAVDALAKKTKIEEVGARAVRRTIQDQVETAIAQKLLLRHRPKHLKLALSGASLKITSEK